MMSHLTCICCLRRRMHKSYQHGYEEAMLPISGNEMTTVSGPNGQTDSQDDMPSGAISTTDEGISQQLEHVTQMHAAAVNGDKPFLARLILSNGSDVDTGDQFGRTPLMFCILADRLDCAELLLKAGAQVNKKDKGGRAALHWAAHKGNFRLLKLLLSKGADCREKDSEGQTALHLCTRHKSPKCMALLLRQLSPGELDNQDKSKRTALHWAASYGNMEHVKMLIKQDSNIGIPDIDGKTPLHWAASSRDRDAVNCVRIILETTPSVINWQDYEGRTALHLAVADGNEAVVVALTSVENCNVSALDNMFRTPLHWAAVLGHSKIVGLLLDNGADYASSDSNGATPLHYAAQNNYDDTAAVFLSRKNVTDEPDVDGRTAFMWAAGKGADDVIRIFLKHNVDIQQVDNNGGTALHAASLSGHPSSVKELLDHGAQLDATDLTKHTPLFRACEMGHTDVVQTLIDFGARVDVLDQDGRSPLHWAALGGHAYICQTLIKYGVDPNIRDYNGRTPLQCAAYGGFVNCMSVLVEHKADINAQDLEGMTALHWACSKGHLDSVKLIIEYNAFPNHMEFTEDRYTPLDYALMGEHHDVAQYMIEVGALSITGIQEIAAMKIQSTFRGYRIRKTFTENKRLLMLHDQLRKEAVRKRAFEETRKQEDIKHKQEVEERQQEVYLNQPLVSIQQENGPPIQPVMKVPKNNTDDLSLFSEYSEGKKEKEYTELADLLKQRQNQHKVISSEKQRQNQFKEKQWAALRIQRAWKNYKMRQVGIMKVAKQSIRTIRLRAGEDEFERQIAALTIQLAWRKYFRRKLLKQLHPNKRQLRMWDPEVIAMKQESLVRQVYGENLPAPFWHPIPKRPVRPYYTRWIPSAAATSYNFAVDRYHPLMAKKGYLPTPFLDMMGHPRDFNWGPLEDEEFNENLRYMRVPSTAGARQYSYHMSRTNTTSGTVPTRNSNRM
ncbi:inversin-like isoform X2 [Mizuhopecten yessoensis]|uniref:inversin-like isoform X2 n=1 Tax=Mizuhopecten yessoensis TaxID=6573 RepID=UPI000B45A16E|nr:inversin-like isoform X2 [Mizuhopecten yessoensis]